MPLKEKSVFSLVIHLCTCIFIIQVFYPVCVFVPTCCICEHPYMLEFMYLINSHVQNIFMCKYFTLACRKLKICVHFVAGYNCARMAVLKSAWLAV